MRDLALHILDIAQNAIAAGAKLIEITIEDDERHRTRRMEMRDDGKGMSAEELAQAAEPLYTTRSEGRGGMGIPLLKSRAQRLSIDSAPGKGTTLSALFQMDGDDLLPLGNCSEVFFLLAVTNPDLEIVLTRRKQKEDGALIEAGQDTREIKRKLAAEKFAVPIVLSRPEAVLWLKRECLDTEREWEKLFAE